MSLIVALCIIGSVAFAVIGSVYDLWDKSRWALSDVLFMAIGVSVAFVFVIRQFLGVR